ncbi:MAG: hypothetical protein M1548_10300, partial [Actinobacteria bacterium]|nr:hypothetical protein [Actinomycetota bacterium]
MNLGRITNLSIPKKFAAILLALALLFLGLPTSSLAAETVIYQNDFESGASNMVIGNYPTPAQWNNPNPVSTVTW